MRNRVVVTYAPDEEERESYRKCLGDLAQIIYGENLSDRDRRKAVGDDFDQSGLNRLLKGGVCGIVKREDYLD